MLSTPELLILCVLGPLIKETLIEHLLYGRHMQSARNIERAFPMPVMDMILFGTLFKDNLFIYFNE